MDNGPGKKNNKRLAKGKQNLRAACQKGKFGKLFSSLADRKLKMLAKRLCYKMAQLAQCDPIVFC